METTDMFATSIKMISSLALVLGTVILAMYLLRKAMSRGTEVSGRSEIIRILSVRYLGGKSSIVLLDVAGTVIVVGVSPSGMSTLAHIDDPEALEQLETATPKKGDKSSFSRHLAHYASRLQRSGSSSEKKQ